MILRDLDRRAAAVARGVEALDALRAASHTSDEEDAPHDAFLGAPLDVSAALTRTPEPIQWLIPDRVPLGRAALLSGLGGSGKSTIATQLATCIALGTSFAGWPACAPGVAMLVLAEDMPEETARRLHAIAEGLGLTERQRETIAQRLHVHPCAGVPVALLAREPGGKLVRTARVEALLQAADRIKHLRLIVLDPGIRFSEGDELDVAHARALGDLADEIAIRTGATVLLVVHAAKATRATPDLMTHTARGAGSLVDAVRAELAVATMTSAEAASRGIDDAERASWVQVAVTKSNFAAPEAYAPTWLRRGPGGVLHAAADALPDRATGRERGGLGKDDLAALDLLWRLGGGRSVAAGTWRNAMVEAGLIRATTDGGRENAARRTARRLLDAGLILSAGAARSTTYAPRSTAATPDEGGPT